MTSKTKSTTGSVTVFTHRVGIDGRLIDGERFYAGDQVPADIDFELLTKMRNIKWVHDIPASRWQPPSDDIVAARQSRLDDHERRASEELERRRTLAEERESDPLWLAERRVTEAEQRVRDADRDRRIAIAERNLLATERAGETQ